MFILKLLAFLALVGALYFSVTVFNEHCRSKFGHAFFTKASFYTTGAALVLVVGGNLWRTSALEHHGDTLNGIVLMVLGAIVAVAMIVHNFRRTGPVYGLGGSILQIGIFSVLAWVGLGFLLLYLGLQFLLLMTARPVYVVNR